MGEAEDKQIDVKFLMRLITFVPTGDLTLILLKGHLLIEEQLVSLIERNLKQPKAIERFRFSERHRLAKAMYYETKNDSIWRSIEILNNVRNHLSHDLEAAQLERKANEFIESVEGFFMFGAAEGTIEERTRQALVFLCGRLDSLKP